MNQPILEMLNKHKIPYRFNEEIDDIDGSIVHFKSGHFEQYDIVIEGVGTHPNSKFLESSNIQLDTQGFIPVNDKFETNISNVYALGDVIKSHYRHVNLLHKSHWLGEPIVRLVLLLNKLLGIQILLLRAI